MSDTDVTQTVADTPTWYDQLAQKFGTAIGAGVDSATKLGTDGWYTGPLTEGFNTTQTNILSSVPGAIGAWGDQFGSWAPGDTSGWDAMQSGLADVTGSGTWDATDMASHVSPYTTKVTDEIARLGNRNLLDNVLPQINTTFTGAGQFGSTRNSDFYNRAIRDSSADIAGKQANALQTAWTQAANDYNQWDANLRNAGNTSANIGNMMGQYGMSGSDQIWQDLKEGWGMAEKDQLQGQKELDTKFKDWLSQIQTPIDLMSKLAPPMQQTSSLYSKNQTQGSYTPTSDTQQLLTYLMGILGTGTSAT